MTFREDESRIRTPQTRENFAWLNRFSLSLLKQHPGKDSIAMKRRACGFIVLVRRKHEVGQFARALLDLALVIRISIVLLLFSKRLCLINSHEGSDEFAVRDTANAVASGAHFAVDLEAAAECLVIEGSGELGVFPWESWWVQANWCKY